MHKGSDPAAVETETEHEQKENEMGWKVYSDDKVGIPEGFYDAVISPIPFKGGAMFQSDVTKTGKNPGRPYEKGISKIAVCEVGEGELAGYRFFVPQADDDEKDTRRFQEAMKVILNLEEVSEDLDVDPDDVARALREHSFKVRISAKGKFVDVVDWRERVERVDTGRMGRINDDDAPAPAPQSQNVQPAAAVADDDDIPF